MTRKWLGPAFIAALIGAGVLPGLIFSAIDRFGSLPGYDHIADLGKVPVIGNSGIVWSMASGATGSISVSGAVVAGDLVRWKTSSKVEDSGIPYANVVLVSRAVNAGTGLAVTNSGLLSADITMSLSTPVAIANGGIGASTATTGFTNLSPQTTKGDLIAYSTLPVRVAVGTTGQTLQSDPTVASGVSWTTDVLGATTNSNAPSGYRGEWCGGSRGHASQLSLTTNTATNIVASGCTLTAGDWEIRGAVNFSATNATTSITDFNIGISATSGALPSANTIGSPISGEYRSRWGILPAFVPGSSNNDDFTLNVPPYRVTIASGSTTTLYLIGFATFTVSTLGANGWFEARRIR